MWASLSWGCLGGHNSKKKKYPPLSDTSRGAGVEGNLSLRSGNLLERRGGEQRKELQTLLLTEVILGFILAVLFCNLNYKKIQAKVVYATPWKSHCGLESFLPLQMLLGTHSFKCWHCVGSRPSHFRIVVKYHIVEITAVDIKLAGWWLVLGISARINSFSNDCFQVQRHEHCAANLFWMCLMKPLGINRCVASTGVYKTDLAEFLCFGKFGLLVSRGELNV